MNGRLELPVVAVAVVRLDALRVPVAVDLDLPAAPEVIARAAYKPDRDVQMPTPPWVRVEAGGITFYVRASSIAQRDGSQFECLLATTAEHMGEVALYPVKVIDLAAGRA